MKYDYSFFKQNVSIIQVAESLGYRFNPSAGRIRLEFVHPDFPNVIISNPKDPAKQVYFTRNVDNDRGSVIDFVKNRLNLFNVSYLNEHEGINKVLASFAQVPYDLSKQLESIKVRHAQPFEINDYNIKPAHIDDLAYLSRERKLSIDTLNKFLPFLNIVQTKHRKYNFNNIGFPYRVPGDDKICGFELVNFNFKQHAPGTDKTNAVWQADLSVGKPYDVFFAESGIDAMSFYQIYKHRYNFSNSLFVSTGGSLAVNQITNVFNQFPHARKHTIFDNDLAGHLFDIRVACVADKKDLFISKGSDRVEFTLPKGVFALPISQVNLTNFKKMSGLRPEVSAHKPENGKDFNQMLSIYYEDRGFQR